MQTILSYRKPDNSFSEHQMIGSHKSTVLILQILMETQSFFSIDPDLIQGATSWVQLRQDDDGSFPPLLADAKLPSPPQSNDILKENVTAEDRLLQEVAEITAETLIAFREYPIENVEEIYSSQKSIGFLETILPQMKTSEALAAVTLALVLYESKLKLVAVEKLRNGSTTEEGEFGWPHFTPKRDAADWLYEADRERTLKEPLVCK